MLSSDVYGFGNKFESVLIYRSEISRGTQRRAPVCNSLACYVSITQVYADSLSIWRKLNPWLDKMHYGWQKPCLNTLSLKACEYLCCPCAAPFTCQGTCCNNCSIWRLASGLATSFLAMTIYPKVVRRGK